MNSIALISEHASPLATLGGVDSGGQNVYVAHVARHLAALGYPVDVFTRRDHLSQPMIVHWGERIRVIHVPAGPAHELPKETLLPWMDEFADWVVEFTRQQATVYDVVHANFFMSGLVALRLREEFGIPFVITFHALGKVRRQWQGKADAFSDVRFEIEDMLVAEADVIIAECRQDQIDLCELYNANPARIRVVPCGFDPQEMRPEPGPVRQALGLDEREFVILHVGRMVPRKGVDTVIQALGLLHHDFGIQARLVIAGGNSSQPDPVLTPHIGTLMQVVEQERLDNWVNFVGQLPRSALSRYYTAADVFVTTPWYEPFGITPLEAMACATPVIGSAVGGIKDTVADGISGFLVPPRDPETLAMRLAALYGNPGRRRSMGAAGLSRVQRLFTWQQVTEKLLGVYRLTQRRVRGQPSLQVSL